MAETCACVLADEISMRPIRVVLDGFLFLPLVAVIAFFLSIADFPQRQLDAARVPTYSPADPVELDPRCG